MRNETAPRTVDDLVAELKRALNVALADANAKQVRIDELESFVKQYLNEYRGHGDWHWLAKRAHMALNEGKSQ